MKKIPLSLCVITLNEESNIRRCLQSVPFASDIVVLDSGSQDQTQTLAQDLGARVFEETWKGFGPQKQRAVELAQFEWVLCLDADEELSPELQAEIYALMSGSLPVADGYRMARRSFYLGRWLYHGGWYPDHQTRLFSKSKMGWSQDQLHETVRGGHPQTLKGDLNHYPFQNLSDQVSTNNRYSTLGAEGLWKKGQRFKRWQILVKPWVKFFELYVFKKGFMDGMPGFIIAVGGAYSYFLRYAKLWEKSLNQR